MASTPSDLDPRQSQAYAPPDGPPPPSHPDPTSTPNPNGPSDTRSHAPQGGAPHPPPSPGLQAYPPPPGGAYPQYSPYAPPQSFPPNQSAYGYQGYPAPGVPGYPGQYPPTSSHFSPSPGQFAPGQYGQYPPPTGSPPTGQYPTGAPPGAGQYPPPTGQYLPPTGQYPGFSPTGNLPLPGMPIGQPIFPGADAFNAQSSPYYQPGYYPAPPVANQPSWYLGSPIPNPHAPPAHHGAQKVPDYDPALTYHSVVKAINSGHDSQLSDILLPLDVFKMDALCDYTLAKIGKSLQSLIEKNHSSFRVTLCALTLGPLAYDVELAHKAVVGLGTNEMLLTELMLGRSGVEIRLLIEGYRIRYGKDLVSVVRSDLSGKVERMFVMALNGQRPPDHLPVDHIQVAADVETLHHASKKKEEVPFFEILINRSNPHIAAVVTGFTTRYKSLSKVIKKTFSGHLETSLLYIMHGAKPKRDGQGIWRDAKLIEKSMAGLGTRDTQLIYRLVRAHWDPNRLEAIKGAYKQRYGKPLEARVKGETSGDYQKLLVAILKSSETNRKV